MLKSIWGPEIEKKKIDYKFSTDGGILREDIHNLGTGSDAVNKFISEKQPLFSLHGHLHESQKLPEDGSLRLRDYMYTTRARG
ncbi:MAG: hypothetical protein ACUVQP_09425 [Bacteroidales bacterium]